MNFIQRYIAGHVELEDIDVFICDWHQDCGEIPIHEYLGLSKEDYAEWVHDPNSLKKFIKPLTPQ